MGAAALLVAFHLALVRGEEIRLGCAAFLDEPGWGIGGLALAPSRPAEAGEDRRRIGDRRGPEVAQAAPGFLVLAAVCEERERRPRGEPVQAALGFPVAVLGVEVERVRVGAALAAMAGDAALAPRLGVAMEGRLLEQPPEDGAVVAERVLDDLEQE